MIPATKREHLYQLVVGKTQAFRPLTADEKRRGFLGWHQRGYLPHCDYPGLIQFITFRLADSMPASRKGEWEHLLKIEDDREKRTKLEAYLDRGVGECHLRQPRLASLGENTLLHFHTDHYDLLAWCVMPNHIHVLVQITRLPMARILQSWKSYFTGQANKILGRTGRLWEPEYWDTYMRDSEQHQSAVRYIENNPTKSKFCRAASDWPYSSARFRDEFQRLVLPAVGAQSSGSARI